MQTVHIDMCLTANVMITSASLDKQNFVVFLFLHNCDCRWIEFNKLLQSDRYRLL